MAECVVHIGMVMIFTDLPTLKQLVLSLVLSLESRVYCEALSFLSV